MLMYEIHCNFFSSYIQCLSFPLSCAPGQIRTDTVGILSPLSLPLEYGGMSDYNAKHSLTLNSHPKDIRMAALLCNYQLAIANISLRHWFA